MTIVKLETQVFDAGKWMLHNSASARATKWLLQMKDKVVQSTLAAVNVPPSCLLAMVTYSSGSLSMREIAVSDFTPMLQCCSICNIIVQIVWLCNAMQHSKSCIALHAMLGQGIWIIMQD